MSSFLDSREEFYGTLLETIETASEQQKQMNFLEKKIKKYDVLLGVVDITSR